MCKRTAFFCTALAITVLCRAQRQFDCAEGDLRLVGGDYEYEGRVEICLSGEWGTICDDIWNSANAQVVCNQLGFNFSAAIAVGRAHYGAGSGPIFLDNVDCEGTEERVFDCFHQGVDVHNCGHHEDAGVYCQPPEQACVDGSIRLAGGETENEGRVELCYGRQWGTVCDDLWDSRNAAVVCSQLGYTTDDAIPVPRALYGQGIGHIYYDDVDCTGRESNLSDCENRGFGVHNCQHSEDAGVLCQSNGNGSCHNGDLRLAGGRDSTEGRVEVCFNGRWGAVCDDHFGNSDARVICRQLGFASGGYGQSQASFGRGSGPIFLDNLNCAGTEERLMDCDHDGVGVHNCYHTEDSSVICRANEERCTRGDLRLMDGDFPNEGRLEICIDNHWGSICESMFDKREVNVTCRQLGFTNGEGILLGDGYFGAGLGMVWLERLQCLGNESHLLNCTRGNSQYSSCRHSKDVSIICPVGENETQSRCCDGEVRLVNGSVPNEGLAEICFNGRWGAICEDGWDMADATVFCNQLNFTGNSAIPVGRSYFSPSTGPIFLDDLACMGTERELSECFEDSQLASHDCTSDDHAGVICPFGETICEDGEIRLMDGGTLLEGRVEICYNSRWGTVCDNVWDNMDASVVCRKIAAEYGIDYADVINAVAVGGSGFGRGDGPIYLKDVRCVGSEENLLECIGAEVGIHDCGSHDNDAGVYCGLQPCEDGAVRLSGGLTGTNNTGRVEVCIRSVWSAICDSRFDQSSAEMVCTQLGLTTEEVVVVGGDFFGHGHLVPTWSVEYVCDDDGMCSLRPVTREPDCPHVGIFCEQIQAVTGCGTGDVRLVGGANPSEGGVEVCLNGHWGKVCDDSWDDNAATVVCGQLNLTTLGAVAIMGSLYGSSPSVDYFLDDVKCTGNESTLFDCQSSPVLTHNCRDTEEAGVTCRRERVTTPCHQIPPTVTVTMTEPTTASIGSSADISSSSSESPRTENTDDGKHTAQVVAIVLPVVIAMIVLTVLLAAIVWLMIQRRRRLVKQPDQFPIIAAQGIAQFSEFCNEDNGVVKPPELDPTTTAI